jgi:hypothetical protein
MRYALALLVAVAGLTGCHRRSPYDAAEVRRLTMPSPLLTTPGITVWSTYAATDYGKRGQPKLTSNETAQLRTYLSEVKPCQRLGLRYGFPNNGQPDDRMVVFFAVQKKVHGYRPGHVFGEPNLLYMKDGELIGRTTGETSDREAIESEPCF